MEKIDVKMIVDSVPRLCFFFVYLSIIFEVHIRVAEKGKSGVPGIQNSIADRPFY